MTKNKSFLWSPCRWLHIVKPPHPWRGTPPLKEGSWGLCGMVGRSDYLKLTSYIKPVSGSFMRLRNLLSCMLFYSILFCQREKNYLKCHLLVSQLRFSCLLAKNRYFYATLLPDFVLLTFYVFILEICEYRSQ